jgi:FAD/FMN-containing dehydrogenase
MEARIRSDLSEEVGKPERLDGASSQGFHRAMSSWEDGADLVARMSLLPSELRVLLEEAHELKVFSSSASRALGAPGAVGSRLRASAHVGVGILRVAVSGLPKGEGDLVAWTSRLQSLRGRLEEKGGSLTLSLGPSSLMRTVGPWGAPGDEKGLMAGLKAEFDPKGILAPGRLGL